MQRRKLLAGAGLVGAGAFGGYFGGYFGGFFGRNPEETLREFFDAVGGGDMERADELTVRSARNFKHRSVTVDTIEQLSFEEVVMERYGETASIEAKRQQVDYAIDNERFDEWTFVHYIVEIGEHTPEDFALLVRGDGDWLINGLGLAKLRLT